MRQALTKNHIRIIRNQHRFEEASHSISICSETQPRPKTVHSNLSECRDYFCTLANVKLSRAQRYNVNGFFFRL